MNTFWKKLSPLSLSFGLTLLLVLCGLLGLSGCAVLKARPADDAGFLPRPELLTEQRERAPFNGYWVFDPEEYFRMRQSHEKVFIDEIDTAVVRAMYEAGDGKEEIKLARIEEAEELARYFREKIRLALEENKQKTVRVVESPGPDTLNLRLALVEVIPTDPGVNVFGTAAGFFIPGGGLIKLLGEGSVAMEGFVDRGKIQDPLEQYKDREGQKSSPFSLKDYQRYAHIRVAIDDWAEQIAALFVSEPTFMIEDSLGVTLNPV